MKVLMTADTVGGVMTYAQDLARLLDHEVVLATFGPRAGARHHQDLKLEWMDEPWEDLERAEAWLLELEARERPDVIHLNGYVHGAAPFSAPRLVVGHSCVLSWWRAVLGCDAPRRWDRYRAAVRRGLHGADAVVAPSAFMLGQLRELYGSGSGWRVIHNGSSAPVYRGPKEPFVLAAGRMWDEAKNLRALEAAAPGLDAAVVIVGEGSAAGPVSAAELAGLRRRAAVFAAPALYEPFGLSILEAARAGCSLVLGDIPSLRELWDGAARFVHPEDSEALAAAIGAALRHPQPAIEAAIRFSCRAMGAAYASLYREVASAAVAV
jgi:glycogen synthase